MLTKEIKQAIEKLVNTNYTKEHLDREDHAKARYNAIKVMFGDEGTECYRLALHKKDMERSANIQSGRKTFFYPAYHVKVTENHVEAYGAREGQPLDYYAKHIGLPVRWTYIQSEKREGKSLVAVIDGHYDDKDMLHHLTYDDYYQTESGRKDGKLWWHVSPGEPEAPQCPKCRRSDQVSVGSLSFVCARDDAHFIP